jgi:hypothetical protein
VHKHVGFSVGFGVAVVILALTMIVWAKSGSVTTTDLRSSASISPHDIMLKSKDLPIQQVESPF